MTTPDHPDSMLLPTVSVWADGVWVADGRDPDSDEPQALDGLVIRWGRTTVVDQPQPSTCSLTLMDRKGGTRFLELLQLGGRLDVRADALVTTTPDPDGGTGQVVISAEFESGPGDTFVQPTTAARLSTTAGGTTGQALRVDTLTAAATLVVLPPGPRQPVGGDPTAWDDIPRAISGETWALTADVRPPLPFAGYQGWGVELVPVTFASPWAAPQVLELGSAESVDVGNGWRRLSGTALPPQGSWVGVAVRFWPIGPSWDALPGVVTTRHNQATDPKATTTRWRTVGAGVGGVTADSFPTTGGPSGVGGPASFYRKTWTTGTTAGTPSAATGMAIYADTGAGRFPITPGKTYTLSAWMRHSSARPKQFQWVPYLYDAAGTLLRFPSSYAPSFPVNTWVRHSITFTAAAAEVSLRCTLAMPSGVDVQEWAAGETLDGTGLLIEEAPAMGGYFDGDSPGASWDGAAGLSTSTLQTSDATAWDDLPGAAARTNLQPDPRFTSTTGKTKSCGSGGNATATLLTGITDHPAGITTAYRGTVVAAVVGVTSWYVGASGVVQAPTEGDWYRAGAWVRMSVGHVMYLRIVNVNGSASTNGPITDVPANTWTWLTVSGKVGPGTTALSVIAATNSGPNPEPGVTQDISGLVLEYFGTDQAAAQQPVTPALYFDGGTPDTAGLDYAWTGTANASTSTASSTGPAVTWDELGRLLMDRVRLNAPAAGTLRQGMVFSGRITDMEARFDDVERATFVDVTAADQRAELGSRDVGDEPWLLETLGSRFQRIVTASGQPIQTRVSTTAAAYQVSWRDVDRQPAIVLLSELATTADGVLWAATHPTTGPYLELESLSDRAALYVLTEGADGVVRIAVRSAELSGAVEVSACDVLLEPVRWRHDIEDMATQVSVTWREQTVDDKGQPAPTDRTVLSTNPALEQTVGRHRVAVSTQLTSAADAGTIADAILGRTGNTQWRVHGLTWRADTTDQLDAGALTRMMQLLDGTTRNGLPLVLTDLPEWSPVPEDRDRVALFLEGGTYSSEDGAWVLDLIVSSASAIGDSAQWDELQPAIVPSAIRTNRMTNPRAISGGATGWEAARGWGSGGNGTHSYYTQAGAPVPGVSTTYRKTWTVAATNNVASGYWIAATATTWLPATAGKVYTASVYVRHTSGGDKVFSLKLGFVNTNLVTNTTPIGGWILQPNTTVASGLGWTRLTITGTAPTGTVAVAVCADIEPGGVLWAVGNTMDATAALVEEAAAAGSYFDGATVDAAPMDYAWTGAANASTSTARDTRTADPGWRWDDMDPAIRWIDLAGVAAP